jgi:hypothetical protein
MECNKRNSTRRASIYEESQQKKAIASGEDVPNAEAIRGGVGRHAASASPEINQLADEIPRHSSESGRFGDCIFRKAVRPASEWYWCWEVFQMIESLVIDGLSGVRDGEPSARGL